MSLAYIIIIWKYQLIWSYQFLLGQADIFYLKKSSVFVVHHVLHMHHIKFAGWTAVNADGKLLGEKRVIIWF